MDTTTPTARPDTRDGRRRRTRRWTGVAAVAAALGALTAAAVALTAGDARVVAGGPGVGLAEGWPTAALAWSLAVESAVVCVGLLRLRTAPDARGRTAVGDGVAVVAVLALVLACDAMPLAAAGYLPLLLVGSLFSADLREGLLTIGDTPIPAQLAVVTVAVLTVVAAVLALADRDRAPAWLRPSAAARWGKVAVAVAVAVPALYAGSRIAWVLGWSVGFDRDAYEAAGGDVSSGLVLALGALLGATLTIGLVRPWGERFWSWLPVLGGRAVPVPLAVVPATVVAALLLPAGVSMIRAGLSHTGIAALTSDLASSWAAIGLTFLWPLWSLALAAATLAYAVRRGAIGARDQATPDPS